jgi:hypothetical protein
MAGTSPAMTGVDSNKTENAVEMPDWSIPMHFKRKRPKNARAGCLLCKSHKANGFCPRHKNMRMGNRRWYLAGEHDLRCEGLR